MLPSSERDRRRYYDDAWPRVALPRPFSRVRIPIPPQLYQSRFGRPTWVLRILLLTLLPIGVGIYLLITWWFNPSTLVFAQSELQRIWQWEISAGHHPSSAPIPQRVGLRNPQANTALRPRRSYVLATRPRNETELPSRPVAGSIADLDLILEFCDFNTGKYGRDCLETLRVGGGLDTLDGRAAEVVDAWKYTFVEQEADATAGMASTPIDANATDPLKHARGTLEPPLALPPPPLTAQRKEVQPCDPAYPRLFHIFWAGPFTDKPYMALLSFLFTQNLGLDSNATSPPPSSVCRPQFWVWIHTNGTQDITAALADNPWSAPFLHPRFKDVIKFQTWNTVQQLDSIPELKTGWRKYKDHLLNSGGHAVKAAPDGKKLDYDKPSVVLSDMARFVICHRFGGIYLDADTILLRDWEELWGWHGAFAYRWSWHDKYNTAVLRLHAGSALGSLLFRTALRNKLDFHPMTISKYLRDAALDRLLLRLPDALFDPAFLTMEHLQLDRPPFPEFQDFRHFFDTPDTASAAPQVVGFEGFFRGAYSYHWHNFWWHAFDSERNWPDLGPRFFEGEGRQRALLLAQERSLKASNLKPTSSAKDGSVNPPKRRDIGWATVLKRTFEAYVRGERPNMYGEWLVWPAEPASS